MLGDLLLHESSVPPSHRVRAATSHVLVVLVTGLLAHLLPRADHRGTPCLHFVGEKTKHVILCLAQTLSCWQSAVTLTPQRKGRKMTTKRARHQHKTGVKSSGSVQHCSHPTPAPAGSHRRDPTTVILPTPLHGLAACHPLPREVAPHVRPVRVSLPTVLAASPGDEPSSKAADHIWASLPSEGSDNPLTPLSIRVTPLIITPKLFLTWACPAASPRSPAQIHNQTPRLGLGVQRGAELPSPALGTRGSCWTSPGCCTVNCQPLFCRNKVNAFSRF